MGDRGPCPACEGSGQVAPGPFAGENEPWPAYVRRAAALILAGCPWGGSAAAAGLVRPLRCPACGGVCAVPAPVMCRFID